MGLRVTPDDIRREQHALLVRAAEIEAQRQQAIRAGSLIAVAALEGELRRLWKRFAALDGAAPAPGV